MEVYLVKNDYRDNWASIPHRGKLFSTKEKAQQYINDMKLLLSDSEKPVYFFWIEELMLDEESPVSRYDLT